MTTLAIQKREDSEDIKDLREKGILPAVMYGAKEETTSISISKKEFEKAFKEAGESTVITLDTANGKKSALIHDVQFDPVKDTPVHVDFYRIKLHIMNKSALIHDVQFDPVKDTPVHVDFYLIEEGKEVEVSVPLDFIGVSPAVKELAGTLVKVMHELSIKGMPAKLPHTIEVDIAVLAELDSNISAKDILLPDGITLMDNADEIVASISVAKEEEEEEVESADISSIEVEKKGKKEEEGESEA